MRVVALLIIALLTATGLAGCVTTHTNVADALDGSEQQYVEIDCARVWGSVNDHGSSWGFRVFDRIGAADSNEFMVVIVDKTDTDMDNTTQGHIELEGRLRDSEDGLFIAASHVGVIDDGCQLRGE